MAVAGLNKLATASFFVRAVILAARAAPTFPGWLCCCLPGTNSPSALCVTVALHGSTWERKANRPRFVKVHKNCFYIRRACYYFLHFYFLYLTYSMTLRNQKKSKYPWSDSALPVCIIPTTSLNIIRVAVVVHKFCFSSLGGILDKLKCKGELTGRILQGLRIRIF